MEQVSEEVWRFGMLQSSLQTDQCLFEGNGGGGLFTGNLDESLRDPGQKNKFNNTSYNEGSYGGFLASGFGTMPSLAVLNCVFEGNAGAGERLFPTEMSWICVCSTTLERTTLMRH